MCLHVYEGVSRGSRGTVAADFLISTMPRWLAIIALECRTLDVVNLKLGNTFHGPKAA